MTSELENTENRSWHITRTPWIAKQYGDLNAKEEEVLENCTVMENENVRILYINKSESQ
jgi:hypothetical protein